ncbi:hypothetical protein [Streptomyces sp. NPDC013457]
MTYAIRAEGLVKRYGTTAAVDGLDLDVRIALVALAHRPTADRAE